MVAIAPKISLHPQLAACIEVLFGLGLWYSLATFSLWWQVVLWVVVRLGLWVALTSVVYYGAGLKRWDHLLCLASFGLGMLGIVLFIDHTDLSWSWYATEFLFVIVPAASFVVLPSGSSSLPYVPKPARRWQLCLSTLGVAGLWSGIGALGDFNIAPLGSWLWIIAGVLCSTLLAWWWWRRYEIFYPRRLFFWVLVFFLLFLEAAWVVMFWPLIFLSASIVLSTVWYLLWLIGRFHLSKEGVDWRRQAPLFVLTGLLLLIFLLFIARWK